MSSRVSPEAVARRKGDSRRDRDFVGKTLSGVTSALEQAVFDQEMAAMPGLLQRTDPRAKVFCALALLLAVGLSRRLGTVLLVCVAALLLALISRLPVGTFARRVWLGIPVFAATVALPSLFMVPGQPLLTLVNAAPFRLTVTDAGLQGAALFVVRVGASVSLAVLLVSTTRWAELLRALRVLGIPESLVIVLGMTYRYLFLVLHSANNLFMARASRTVGRTSGAEQRRWAAGAAGTLVSRSMKMSGEVLLAMRARGFSGEVRTAPDPRMRDEDWLLVCLGIALAAGLLVLDGRLA